MKEFKQATEFRCELDKPPFQHVQKIDMIILSFAVLLRFLVVVNKKAHKLDVKGVSFTFYKYFDYKHIIRWVLHIVSAIAGILVLPELFVTYIQPKYFEGLNGWTYFGSGVVGFLGYDLIRGIEKITAKYFNSKGVDINAK